MRRFILTLAWVLASCIALLAVASAVWASALRNGVQETSALIAEVILWLTQVALVAAAIACLIRLAGRGHWLNGGSNNA